MGLGVTSVMNLLMAFCRQPALMLGIWCVNGLAQAFLWPPLVRLMSELFSGELYEKAVIGAWPVIAVLGAAVCLACVRPWRRFE